MHPLKLPIKGEINFDIYGGDEYFFYDLDADGSMEIISYQGPATLGSKMYSAIPDISSYLPHNTSLSAFRLDGTRLWTWGKPYNETLPHVSHAYESTVSIADIDGDGICEVVLADGNRLVILNGINGTEKNVVSLEHDNYYIVQAINGPLKPDEAVIVIKNGEGGYEPWNYSEPVVGFNSHLQPVWGPLRITGGGHHILAMDINHDSELEYLIGYCLLKANGKILWTVDSVVPENCRQLPQHVDYTSYFMKNDGQYMLALAGSERAYLVTENGKTKFSRPDTHPQGAALGRFRTDSEYQAAFYNAPDGPMVLFDSNGTELWRNNTPRKWPAGLQSCAAQQASRQPFHRNRPIVTLKGRHTDWVGYADGGWPWGMDGNGRIELQFEVPRHAMKTEYNHQFPFALRRDDLGFSFALKSLDIFNEEQERPIIYDRKHMWIYGGIVS
ncbi:MAG: hypothetical protein A2017_12135 [Lentisphaerae bacterium GWF2_44_16]|nr:MAG: hypothetical protein A2017_12135 [Lentisphaerae bacterium GWF2_44_16]